MLTILALALAPIPAPSRACADVKRECRTCTASNGKRRCSTAGIACQPSIRICRAKRGGTSLDGRTGGEARGG